MELREIRHLFDRTKTRWYARDEKMQKVLSVRQGRMREVYPDLFPEGPFDQGIVANMVDIAARDLSEVIAPLPSFTCSSSTNVSDIARKFAEKRGKIANGYVAHSNMQKQMYTAADRYVTYGFVPAMVEIDFEARLPRIRFFNSKGAYPVFDRWNELKAAFFSFYQTRDELVAAYPDRESVITAGRGYGGNDLIEVVRYHCATEDVLFLPGKDGVILEKVDNPTGMCLAEWIQRPGVDDEPHGQFDDVLAVQVAKSRFALLSLEAAQKSVQAPIVLPPDAQELAIGPDAVIRTANGQQVRRVPIEVPQAAFAQQSILDQELRNGSRYPEARGGNMEGSVVTGRGVQALMSGFDTQVRTAQAMFAAGLERLIEKAFRVDEAIWPEVTKSVRGNANGTPYEVEYRPGKDIKGVYTVDVAYGLMAGLDPNRALVFGLQARGDKLISRDFLREQMPFALDPSEEEAKIDIEEMRDALKQAVAGYAQAIPVLAQTGQDPGEILERLSQIILGRQKGRPIEEVIAEAFAKDEEEEVVAAPGMGMEGEAGFETGSPMGPGQAGDIPDGLSPATGMLRGVAPGQAGMPQGGRPDMQQLLASLTSGGQPNLSAGVTRRIPI